MAVPISKTRTPWPHRSPANRPASTSTVTAIEVSKSNLANDQLTRHSSYPRHRTHGQAGYTVRRSLLGVVKFSAVDEPVLDGAFHEDRFWPGCGLYDIRSTVMTEIFSSRRPVRLESLFETKLGDSPFAAGRRPAHRARLGHDAAW